MIAKKPPKTMVSATPIAILLSQTIPRRGGSRFGPDPGEPIQSKKPDRWRRPQKVLQEAIFSLSNNVFSAQALGSQFSPRNPIGGGGPKKCSRRPFSVLKMTFFRPRPWEAKSVQETRPAEEPQKMLQEAIFSL